jgi:four helix bundle protein
MSYRNLEIWKLANELVVEIHEMTLKDLPKHEMYETGSQIRKSSKSTKSNIVEGYGRRRYKQDFIHFLTISIGSNDETMDHLETLFSTKSLKDEKLYVRISTKITELGKRLNMFIQSVEQNHISGKKF